MSGRSDPRGRSVLVLSQWRCDATGLALAPVRLARWRGAPVLNLLRPALRRGALAGSVRGSRSTRSRPRSRRRTRRPCAAPNPATRRCRGRRRVRVDGDHRPARCWEPERVIDGDAGADIRWGESSADSGSSSLLTTPVARSIRVTLRSSSYHVAEPDRFGCRDGGSRGTSLLQVEPRHLARGRGRLGLPDADDAQFDAEEASVLVGSGVEPSLESLDAGSRTRMPPGHSGGRRTRIWKATDRPRSEPLDVRQGEAATRVEHRRVGCPRARSPRSRRAAGGGSPGRPHARRWPGRARAPGRGPRRPTAATKAS